MGLYTPIQNCIRIGLFILEFVVVIVSLVHKPKIKKAFMVAIGIAVFSLFSPQWEILGSVRKCRSFFCVPHMSKTLEKATKKATKKSAGKDLLHKL